MNTAHQEDLPRLSNRQTKFIKSLRLKKYRQQENAFMVEGNKNVLQLINAAHPIKMLVGTPSFLSSHRVLWEDASFPSFQASEDDLSAMSSLTTNHAALAIAPLPAKLHQPPPHNSWGLILDQVNDPGNLGTIVRIADWYGIPTIACSPNTVDLYNPKTLQASMGSFLRVKVHYTPLLPLLQGTPYTSLGTFTEGESLHHTVLPPRAWVVIGNEAHGIDSTLLPHLQARITIPRYGHAESLNAAIATAIICDRWKTSTNTSL